MKKILALIMVVAMVATLASVVFAADAKGPSPVAAYDFTGKKLADTTGNNPDVTIDENFATEADEATLWPNDTTDAGVVNYVKATDDGLRIVNAFVRVPEIFKNVDEKDITGLTVSITLNKMPDKWAGNEWSENIFSFASEWKDSVVGDDSGDSPDRAAASFYCSDNGNVGTARRPYSGQGNWLDGSLNGKLKGDENAFHNVTVTLDFATNVASMYFDGELTTDTTKVDWEVKCKLTAAEVKTFVANAIGYHTGGNWGNWGFFTVADYTVYSSALNADQVKTLATDGWKALATPADTPTTDAPTTDAPATGDSGNQNPTGAPKTGVATIALAIVAMGSGAFIVTKKRH